MDSTTKLGQEKIGSLLATFSIPAIVGMLVMSLYNVIDRVFIGNTAGSLGIAAITVGFPQGAQPIIGYNYGARRYDRVKATLKYAAIAATAIATAGFVLIRLFPTLLITVFNSQDAELIAFGSNALIVFLTFLPLIGFQIVGSGYFQAVGKPQQSLILSLSRQVLILIPALLVLPRFFQLNGVLMAGPLSDLAASALTGAWLLVELRDLNRRHAKSRDAELPVKSPAGVEL